MHYGGAGAAEVKCQDTAAINTVCGLGGGSGVPNRCNAPCATVFEPWYTRCQAHLAAMSPCDRSPASGPLPQVLLPLGKILKKMRGFLRLARVYVARVYFAQIKNPGNIKLADFGSTFIYSYYKLDVLKIPE